MEARFALKFGGDYILYNDGITIGATFSTPYNTFNDGFTFSTSISLSTHGTVSDSTTLFNKERLIELLIGSASDNRDGIISLQSSNLIISDTSGEISNITQAGSYSLTFNLKDIAQNNLDGCILNLTITS